MKAVAIDRTVDIAGVKYGLRPFKKRWRAYIVSPRHLDPIPINVSSKRGQRRFIEAPTAELLEAKLRTMLEAA